jgi:hypothetical protein
MNSPERKIGADRMSHTLHAFICDRDRHLMTDDSWTKIDAALDMRRALNS